MKTTKLAIVSFVIIILSACGTLEKKTILINSGDDKSRVFEIMGTPEDRQMEGQNEAWQYCMWGAGFGYNDHRIIWFNSGRVTGITSYRTTGPGCTMNFKTIRWEDAPHEINEYRLKIR
jgi:hypothetical protein